MSSKDPQPSLSTYEEMKAKFAAMDILSGSNETSIDGNISSLASRRSRRVQDKRANGGKVRMKLTDDLTVKAVKQHVSPVYYGEFYISISDFYTCQIEKLEKIPIFYQNVFYKGEELSESDTKIKSLDLGLGDFLQMRPLADNGVETMYTIDDSDFEMIEDDEETLTKKKRKAPPVEAKAFQGTLLSGI
jgi:hypothetical protein